MSSRRSPRSSPSSSSRRRGSAPPRRRTPGGLIPSALAGGAASAAHAVGSRPAWASLRARALARRDDGDAAGFAVAALLVSRMLVWVAGMWAIVLFGIDPALNAAMDFAHVTSPFGAHTLNLLFAPTMRWDSVWYLHIAHAGYDSRQATAFFPLLPLLLRGGEALIGSAVIAGTVISLTATAVGGWLLYRLARLDLPARAAALTVALIAVFPTSLFLSAIYTESLFLAFSVGAFYAARRERWALAGLLGGLAAATRSSGVLLVVALALLYLYGPRDGGRRVRAPEAEGRRSARPGAEGRRAGRPGASWGRLERFAPRYAVVDRGRAPIAWLALVPAGLLAYCAYLDVKFGSPTVTFSAEKIWGRSFAGPFGGAVTAVLGAPGALSRVLGGTQHPFGFGSPLGWEANQLIDLPFLAFAAGGLWLAARRLPFAYTAYALLLLAQALSYPIAREPLQSFSRYLLVIFPVFMGWAVWLADRPLARRLALTGLTAGLLAFSALWAITVWIE